MYLLFFFIVVFFFFFQINQQENNPKAQTVASGRCSLPTDHVALCLQQAPLCTAGMTLGEQALYLHKWVLLFSRLTFSRRRWYNHSSAMRSQEEEEEGERSNANKTSIL